MGSTAPIVSQLSGTGLCASVSSSAPENGAPVVLAPCTGQNSQQFTWASGSVVKVFSTMCLDAQGEYGRENDPVTTWPCHGRTNQQWRTTAAGEIRGINDLCMTVDAAQATAGARLVIRTCTGAANQKWGASGSTTTTPPPTTTSASAIGSQLGAGICASVSSSAPENGAPILLAPCNGQSNQQFTWASGSVVKVFSTMCMDAQGEYGREGDPVTTWPCHGRTNQQWRTTSAGEIRGINDLCMTADGTSGATGTRLVIRTCTGATNQKWTVGSDASALVPQGGTSTTTPPAENTPTAGITAPELPRTYLNTAPVTPTGATINVRAGGDLQKAIDAANPGDQIVLQAGATFTGNFILPNKSGSNWITIRTDGAIPAPGTRVTPANAGAMPKIVTPNVTAAIGTAPGAHHWRLIGLEVMPSASLTWAYAAVTLGDGGWGQSTLESVPHDIVLDRLYIHGNASIDLRRCIGLNSASSAVIDSWLSDCHSKGNDSQAIGGWNGPGPYKIVNNHLEGAGENIMFGGTDPSIPNLVPSDIEIRRNHVFKPLGWQGVWGVKNLLELKNSRRVLIEGNVFENNWADAQVGFAILMWPVNQDGTAPWSTTSDVTFQYNIVKRVAGGFNLIGVAVGSPAVRMTRIRIANNSFEQVGDGSIGAAFAQGRLFQMTTPDNVEIAHNSGAGSQHGIILYGTPISAPLVVRDNVFEGGDGIVSADGQGVGIYALNFHAPGWQVRGNVIGTNWFPSRLASFPTGNTYTANGASSTGTVQTTDGVTVGVDRNTLSQRTAGVVQ